MMCWTEWACLLLTFLKIYVTFYTLFRIIKILKYFQHFGHYLKMLNLGHIDMQYNSV